MNGLRIILFNDGRQLFLQLRWVIVWVAIEIIQQRQGLIPDRREEEPPYEIEEYLHRGDEVGLLEEKKFAAMQTGDKETRWFVSVVELLGSVLVPKDGVCYGSIGRI